MASIYGSTKGGIFGGSSAANGYAATALKLAKEHQSHGDGGILGHIEGIAGNLAKDVVSSAEGLPAGLVHMATQSPIKSAKEIYAAEAATWSPLLTGDYHKFIHNFYEHPLGPILDTVGLVTLGSGLAARAGLLSAEGGVRAIQAGSKLETIGRYADNPAIRARQKAFDSLTKYRENAPEFGRIKMTMPKSTPFIGEVARGQRALARLTNSRAAKNELLANSYNHAAFKLNKPWKHTAWALFNDGRSPLERLHMHQMQVAKRVEPLAKEHDKILANHAAWENILHSHDMIDGPTNKTAHATVGNKIRAKLHAMNERAVAIEKSYPAVDELTVRALSDPRAEKLFHDAQEVHAQLKQHGYEDGVNNLRLQQVIGKVRMSKDVKDLLITRDAAKAVAEADAKIAQIDPLRAEARKYSHHLIDSGAQMLPSRIVSYIEDGATKAGELQTDGKVRPLGHQKSIEVHDPKPVDPLTAHELVEQLHPMEANSVDREWWHSQGMEKALDKVKADHAKTGRAEPVYFPDKMILDKKNRFRANKGSGRASNIQVHKNTGALYTAGLLSMNPLILSKQFMEHAMIAHTQDVASELLSHAEPYVGNEVPKGYVALTKMGISRGYMNDHLKAFREQMVNALDGPDGGKGIARAFLDNHITKNVENADTAGEGHMMIVPEKMVNALMPEYHKSSAFMNAVWKKPGAIWKHIVLAGRPAPFIVNNVVGNSVMYGLRNNDLASLRALLLSHHNERAFEETQAGSHLTFGHSVSIKQPTKLQKAVNVGYNVSSAHEHLLRRNTFVAAAEGMKVVQQAARDLGGRVTFLGRIKTGTYDASKNDDKTILHAALDKAEAEHGGVHAEIEKRIEDTMGDYRNFSKTEKQLKQVMPFYAWNRHAVRAYYKLLTDKPLTAAMITLLGQQGSAETNKMLGDVPEFMKAYVPAHILKTLGYSDKGHTAVINTSVLNPEATVADTVKSVRALVSGKPSDAAASVTSNLSPFITAPIEAVTGKSLLTGAPIKGHIGSSHGLLGSTLGAIATSLPQPKTIASLIPGNLPGSSHANPNDLSSQFTPTGKPKTKHADTVSKDWQTNLLNSLFGIPAKSIDIPAAQTWQKSIETKAAAAKPHVAKTRKKKSSSGSIY